MDTTIADEPEIEVGSSGPEEGLPPVVEQPIDPELAAAAEEAAEATLSLGMSESERRDRWQARRPVIGHLKDGVVEVAQEPDEMGVKKLEKFPLFDVGQRVVVDITTTLLPGLPWLQTLVGRVRTIDDDTGLVTIFDEDSDARIPTVRYVSYKDGLHIFKLAPEKGDPFAVRAVKAQLKKEALAAAKPGEKRGRGRPRGVKNRPKEVIKAEKEAARAARNA